MDWNTKKKSQRKDLNNERFTQNGWSPQNQTGKKTNKIVLLFTDDDD